MLACPGDAKMRLALNELKRFLLIHIQIQALPRSMHHKGKAIIDIV